MRRFRQAVLAVAALPLLYLGVTSAAFMYRARAADAMGARVALAPAAPLGSATRLLVFSPHPDDEVLGCGGSMAQVVRAGGAVRVVYMTSGDAFRVAVERSKRRVSVKPADFIAFGELRQQESIGALRELGIGAEAASFLGYPDRGLMPLWLRNWAPDARFRSRYTRVSASPYDRGHASHRGYCGAHVMADVLAAMDAFEPTDVLVTHPSDDHQDHVAASAFVARALQVAVSRGSGWAGRCALGYYLVHRADWPTPRSNDPEAIQRPPVALCGLDTDWTSRALTPLDVERKRRALERYASQTAMMPAFLMAFVRSTEVIGSLTEFPVQPLPGVVSSELPSDVAWSAIPMAIRDPANDSILRSFQGEADIADAQVCRDEERLFLRVRTRAPISPRCTISVFIRYFGDDADGSAGGSLNLKCGPRGQVDPPNTTVQTDGQCATLAVPLRDIGYAQRLAITVSASVAGMPVDSTGIRFLRL